MELERAEHGAGHEGFEGRCVRDRVAIRCDRRDRGGDGIAVARGARESRAGPAHVDRPGPADTDEQHQPERGVGVRALRHRHLDDLADCPGHPAQLGRAEQIDLDRLDQVSGAGTQQDAGVVAGRAGQYRHCHRVDTDDGGGEEIAECELGG